jgi:hypothetical protein
MKTYHFRDNKGNLLATAVYTVIGNVIRFGFTIVNPNDRKQKIQVGTNTIKFTNGQGETVEKEVPIFRRSIITKKEGVDRAMENYNHNPIFGNFYMLRDREVIAVLKFLLQSQLSMNSVSRRHRICATCRNAFHLFPFPKE